MENSITHIIWTSNCLGDLEKNVYHTLFDLPDKQLPLTVGEVVSLGVQCDDRDAFMQVGLAIVTSIKFCRIDDIDSIDYKRQKGEFRTRLGTVQRLGANFNTVLDYSSIIRIVTLRKNDHDLASLNRYVKKSLSNKMPANALAKKGSKKE